MTTVTHWLGGGLHDGNPKRTGRVFDPSTGKQTAEVALAESEDIPSACHA